MVFWDALGRVWSAGQEKLFSHAEAITRVLCPVLGYPVQESQGTIKLHLLLNSSDVK